ncbi:hypothetical protein RRF57_004283 [Xylaria bambusicola]|uniref:Uncharacterized protein n=1 Tax=Xylaria bambusicola TaxID=326684 RepID=A0AAN7Z6B8_9PEZI
MSSTTLRPIIQLETRREGWGSSLSTQSIIAVGRPQHGTTYLPRLNSHQAVTTWCPANRTRDEGSNRNDIVNWKLDNGDFDPRRRDTGDTTGELQRRGIPSQEIGHDTDIGGTTTQVQLGNPASTSHLDAHSNPHR